MVQAYFDIFEGLGVTDRWTDSFIAYAVLRYVVWPKGQLV